MRYRGPDASHIVSAGDLCVGFARLAIVDTDAAEAQQPHRTAKGRIVVMNGEIYNYHSLDPAAKSEVELLGRMLDDGLDPRHFIDGDYAIASFDPSNRLLTLYRDRFGACPLYYQVKPFVAVSSERRWLNSAIELMPHQKVVIRVTGRFARGKVVQRNRWPHYGLTVFDSPPPSVPYFKSLLRRAVLSRAMHSDTGFSVTCSGGLDSSAVIFAMRDLGIAPKLMLCVSFGDTEDSRHALQVASSTGFPLKVIYVDEALLARDRDKIMEHSDCRSLQPLQWRVAVRNWYVAQNSPTRVVLSGEGSDELFSGYPPHPERLKIPYRIAAKQLGALNSLPKCSLDLSNKIGLAHSVEFRAPFLHSLLSYSLLATQTGAHKHLLRSILSNFGAPADLVHRGKWGSNEQLLDASMENA